MFTKKIKLILIIFIFYQTPVLSKSNSFNHFDTENLSKYFSGIIAFENKNNSKALDFFNSSKKLINKHDPYLKKYIHILVAENKISQAIKIIKKNLGKTSSNFLDAYLLLVVDSVKNKDFDNANKFISKALNISENNRFDLAILESLEQYVYVFKENKILSNNKSFGKLSIISETLQRCYLKDPKTEVYFSNLINGNQGNFTRYIYFYLSYLIEQDRLDDAKMVSEDLDFLNTTLLLSQGKSWIENMEHHKFINFFSCSNYNDVLSEFFFVISNLYSSEDDFDKSNFYLNLSGFLNPKFIFNLSLVAENQFFNEEYDKAKKTLKIFKKDNEFFYWYRVKKEAQIITKIKNQKESLNYITEEFKKIKKPNNKIIFDIANFNKNAKEYKKAIKFYSKLINSIDNNHEMTADLLYRRGGSYERIGEYDKADKDLLESLKINSEDAYVLNYLAYSWLERNYKIDEAMQMLEVAYAAKKNDPYIIDSIGWAYYLINNYSEAEKLLKRAVELMPNDPIVNDHYGDILWRLDRKIQARYFWKNVLKMKDVEKDLIDKINRKMVNGLKSS